MRVFFISSPRRSDKFIEVNEKIISQIARLGYILVDSSSPIVPYEDFVKTMSAGESAYQKYSQEKEESIKKADICIFEASVHSTGIGFLVKESLAEGKPTIVLFHKSIEIPYFIAGIKDEKLIVRSYEEKNLVETIQSSLTLARERRDKRFNFFISPKLLEYLEKASNDEGTTKSKFIRNLIIAHMKK